MYYDYILGVLCYHVSFTSLDVVFQLSCCSWLAVHWFAIGLAALYLFFLPPCCIHSCTVQIHLASHGVNYKEPVPPEGRLVFSHSMDEDLMSNGG